MRRKVDTAWITQDVIDDAKRIGDAVAGFVKRCGAESASISVSDDTVFATVFFKGEDGTRRQYHIDIFGAPVHRTDVRGVEWEKSEWEEK